LKEKDGECMLFLEYLVVEFVFISMGGISLFAGNKGILIAGLTATVLNVLVNSPADIIFWEPFVVSYCLVGLLINTVLNRRTDRLRVIKVSGGSGAALFASGLFFPMIAGFLAWLLILGIPLAFTYRETPKSVTIQIIFKFIFSTGWLIIGNILY
jgi:hypothetical protein